MISNLINSLQIVVLLYLGVNAIYILILSIAGLFKIKVSSATNNFHRNIAVLIPGYKEDNVIIETAKSALKQNYPSDKFDIIIIADSFLQETISKLQELPVKLIEVSFEKSTKSKALNLALELLPEKYEIAIVLDADNIMEPFFLDKINNAFSQGSQIIQGHRVAKNLDSSMAILDAISEEINNHLFRKGHCVLGLSSALIGSAMAFDYQFFKFLMKKIKAVGGFDKEIELYLTCNHNKIDFLDDAIVYDEKVSESESFSKQRMRWLSAQFFYFSKSFYPALKSLIFSGNIDYFLKSYQQIQPPRILLLGFSWLILLVSIIFNNENFIYYWFTLALVVSFSMLISIPKHFWNIKLLYAILNLPRGFILMFLSLFQLRGANKAFIHTKHGSKQ